MNGILTAHYKYAYGDKGNIVRSIDLLGQKEYNYEYENGNIIRSVEYNIQPCDEIVTAKTPVNTVRYTYNTAGKLTKKVTSPADGADRTVYYETTDDNTSACRP